MIGGKVQSERPEGRVVLEDGHCRVVGEVGLVQHLELLVAAALQEGRTHSANVFQIDATIQVKYLPLAMNFLVPLTLAEPFPETVTKVQNNFIRFMAICVESVLTSPNAMPFRDPWSRGTAPVRSRSTRATRKTWL